MFRSAAVVDVTEPRGADRVALVRATFQLCAGLGPTRERALWAAGITDWAALGDGAGLLPAALLAKTQAAITRAEAALAGGDLPTLAALFPTRELWRLYGAFPERAVCLDIEVGGEDDEVSAIGLYDGDGPRILLAGAQAGFPAQVTRDHLLVSFNGAAYDVPALRRRFPDWDPPAAHVDLRAVYTRLGHWGGLKAIEELHGLGRPEHLRGLDGSRACWLWRHAKNGSAEALRRFAEYNLYDTVNLRALLVMAYNRLLAATALPVAPLPGFLRGDVLYDVSKLLLTLSFSPDRARDTTTTAPS